DGRCHAARTIHAVGRAPQPLSADVGSTVCLGYRRMAQSLPERSSQGGAPQRCATGSGRQRITSLYKKSLEGVTPSRLFPSDPPSGSKRFYSTFQHIGDGGRHIIDVAAV